MPKLSYYRPKNPRPITVGLTDDAHALLAATVARTSASRSDVVEQLVRRFAHQVNFRHLSLRRASVE